MRWSEIIYVSLRCPMRYCSTTRTIISELNKRSKEFIFAVVMTFCTIRSNRRRFHDDIYLQWNRASWIAYSCMHASTTCSSTHYPGRPRGMLLGCMSCDVEPLASMHTISD
ncbi:hypothetical protein Tcan_18951 [Toxocara canis]|uniref:Uncharacterized protein n=1 Tax=Toxocara canis TaxID=6265 RepID=A0A0B2VWA4_TOXCA|nr:hypothetical protein Tcan_18951 [Toxocara canis]